MQFLFVYKSVCDGAKEMYSGLETKSYFFSGFLSVLSPVRNAMNISDSGGRESCKS